MQHNIITTKANGCADYFEAVAIPIFVGEIAITRVEYRCRSRLRMSRPQYGTFTLPKRCNATSSPKETETNEAVSSDGRQVPARSTAFAEGLTATAALYQTFGQSLGCRREADRSEAHTAVDLMAAPVMCSDFTRMPRQRTDRQPSRLKV